MSTLRWLQTSAAMAACVFIATAGLGLEAQDYGAAEGIEVQTRGPVHEAFAEVVSLEPEAGIIVGEEPPPPIEELPPGSGAA